MNSLLDVKTTALRLGVNDETIRRWIKAGRLQSTRLGYHTLRISEAALDEFVRARTSGS